ncbi:MAG: PilN domain-containing protein [Terriglobia bacterium]
MIRINLIQSSEKQVEAKTAARGGLRDRKEFFPLLALVISFAVVGLLYEYWTHQIDTLNRQLVSERQEAARLTAVEAQNRQYESQLSEINRHIDVIQTLEKNRTGPLDLMARLGNAADRVNGVYLTSVTSQNGRLSLQGQSDTVAAVAGFIASLETSGTFGAIELRQVFEDDQGTRVSFKFDLECSYTPPVEMAASALPAPPSGTPGRPPGR